MNYFIHDKRDLSPAYVKRCRAFLNSRKLRYTPTGILLGVDLGPRPKPQAPSRKRHEPDTIK